MRRLPESKEDLERLRWLGATLLIAGLVALISNTWKDVAGYIDLQEKIENNQTRAWLYLVCHENRHITFLGGFFLNCEKMSPLPYNEVNDMIWKWDFLQELRCTDLPDEKRNDGFFRRFPCNEETNKNFAKIGKDTAKKLHDCLGLLWIDDPDGKPDSTCEIDHNVAFLTFKQNKKRNSLSYYLN